MTSAEHGATAVVAHRLRPPPRPAVHYSRAALVRRVQGLRPGGICLIDAPPGYGSVGWVSVPDEPRVVIQLDAHELRLRRLYRKLGVHDRAAALARLEGAGVAVHHLGASS